MKGSKRLRRISSMLITLSLLILEASAIGAAEVETVVETDTPVMLSMSEMVNISQYDTDGDGQVTVVIMPEVLRLTTVSAAYNSGTVVDNGVRLRATASTSGTVKELMYYGETVLVNAMTTNEGLWWFYVQRVKTGTNGWACADYINYL